MQVGTANYVKFFDFFLEKSATFRAGSEGSEILPQYSAGGPLSHS